jgi:hypothetical protein
MGGAAVRLPHRTPIRLTPEPPFGVAHGIKVSRQTSDITDRRDLRCFTRPLDSLPARALMPMSECWDDALRSGAYQAEPGRGDPAPC